MYTGRFYVTVNVAQMMAAVQQGKIDPAVLFGTSGDTGLVVECDMANLRTALDGTMCVMKFPPYDDERSPTEEHPLDYLIRLAGEAGIQYDIYSYTPAKMGPDGHYDDCTYGEHELPLILEEMAKPEWTTDEL